MILFGKDNTAYEYANFTNDEKVEIVVTGAVNDRLNILDYAPHYQKVPDEIANRLTFLTDY